jgi:hypothetical protein
MRIDPLLCKVYGDVLPVVRPSAHPIMRILLIAAAYGPNVLFCMPNRTRCVLLVSANFWNAHACPDHRLPIFPVAVFNLVVPQPMQDRK